MGTCQCCNEYGDLTHEEIEMYENSSQPDTCFDNWIQQFNFDFGETTREKMMPLRQRRFKKRPFGLRFKPESPDDEYAAVIISNVGSSNEYKFRKGDVIISINRAPAYGKTYLHNIKLLENLPCSSDKRLLICATSTSGFKTMKQWAATSSERIEERKLKLQQKQSQKRAMEEKAEMEKPFKLARRKVFVNKLASSDAYLCKKAVIVNTKGRNTITLIYLVDQPGGSSNTLGSMASSTVLVLSRLLVEDFIHSYMMVKVLDCVSEENLKGKIGWVQSRHYKNSADFPSSSFWIWKDQFPLDEFQGL